MAEGQRSAASMNFAEVQSTDAGVDSKARGNISWEAQRKTAGPKAIEQYAAANPAINVEKTHLNVDMVNAGDGTFRPTRSIAEVVAYGDDRVARMSTTPKAGNRVALTAVGQLPWAYCEPDGTEYQAVDKSGKKKFYSSGPRAGQPVMLPRYRIREDRREEAMQYFADWLEYQADLLPGGQSAMHGYSINLDESRPHIQLLSDPFEDAPSKKRPDALKSGYSRAFGRHPKDPMVPELDQAGQPVLDDDGKPKLVKDTASTKMTRYQAGLRSFMVERGYEVDPERDERRHNRHLGLADYKELKDSELELLMHAEMVSEAEAGLGLMAADLAEERQALHEEAQTLEVDVFGDIASEVQGYERAVEKDLDVQRAEVAQVRKQAESEGREEGIARGIAQATAEFEETEAPKLRADAREEGKSEGLAAGKAEGKAEGLAEGKAEAAKIREKAKEAAEKAQANEQAARIAREEAERRLAEIPEFDPRTADADMRAVHHDAMREMKVVQVVRKDGKLAYRTDERGKPIVEPADQAAARVAEAKWKERAGLTAAKPMPTETIGARREKYGSKAREADQQVREANQAAPAKTHDQDEGVSQ
ncbi:hypothetical protein [uncultured Gordonia sp.]|uniref:hypothetical protein n=1 Tax=uncultured Gordonia sp. TaxID=198437 RepID=UPI00262B888E|nr:hypothetical protein [uncultured Gordonia sp.]